MEPVYQNNNRHSRTKLYPFGYNLAIATGIISGGVHRAYISLKCQKSTPVQSPILKKVKILKIHLTYTEKYAIIATGASPYPVVQLFFGSTNWFNCFVPIHQVQNERRTKKPDNKRYRSKTKDIRC